MRPRSHLIATSVVLALSGATLAGPATTLAHPGHRTPAATGAAPEAISTPDGEQDWRAPDTIDAATAAEAGGLVQDSRSPDAVDAATPSLSQPDMRVTPPPAVARPSTGFDWDSAVIGAGGAIGLVAVSAGTGLALRRRRSAAPSRRVVAE
jgi:hypothetical protein